MKRRDYLRAAGAAAAAGLAGCGATGGTGSTGSSSSSGTTSATSANGTSTGSTSGSRTLTVATYSSYVGDTGSPGAWLKSAFEDAHDGVTVEWKTPTSGSANVTEYIQRARHGASIDADVYVGLNTDELVLVDQKLSEPLFATLKGDLSHAGDVKEGLTVDPKGRAYPYDTGYVNPVADATVLKTLPTSFDDLLDQRYHGDLIAENAQNSDTGKAFLLWTVHEKGASGYLDYWKRLLDNGVKILSDWQPAYDAYTQGEAPIVVSYSTDQVYAANKNENLKKYTIDFLNHEAYANPESAAVFASSDRRDLATAFVDFMLSPTAQKHIPQLNYEFPSTTTGALSGNFATYAKQPRKPVTFTYDQLAGNVTEWVDSWARLVAQH